MKSHIPSAFISLLSELDLEGFLADWGVDYSHGSPGISW